MESKISTLPHVLCKGLPKEFVHILEYLNNMDSNSPPDYRFIEEQFDRVARREKIFLDMKFNWTTEK